MRKVCLFIAMSLDGYIADKNGDVNWLNGQDENDENIDSYGEFIKSIDTILMGWNTYDKIVNELAVNMWPYENCITYVLTYKDPLPDPNVQFYQDGPVSLLNKLLQEDGKNIWICGGANIVQQLVKKDLIDQYYITIIPTILGSGIKLFDIVDKKIKLRLIKSQRYNGMIDLVYEKR